MGLRCKVLSRSDGLPALYVGNVTVVVKKRYSEFRKIKPVKGRLPVLLSRILVTCPQLTSATIRNLIPVRVAK